MNTTHEQAVIFNMSTIMCSIGGLADQVVIRSNAKEFSEVTEGNGCICLKPEVTMVMCRSQITSLTKKWRDRNESCHKWYKISHKKTVFKKRETKCYSLNILKLSECNIRQMLVKDKVLKGKVNLNG